MINLDVWSYRILIATKGVNYMKYGIRITLIVLFSVILSSCSCILDTNHTRFSSDILEDESRMLQSGDSFFYRTRRATVTGEKANLSFNGFSGIETLFDLTCFEPSVISLTIDAQVNSMSYKIVLVDYTQQSVVTLLQGSGSITHTLTLHAGRYAVKMVGYTVQGSVTLQVNASDSIQVKLHNL